MERHILSKSTFIRGLQCLKSLYLYKNRYFLRDKLSFEQKSKFLRGTNVGILARDLFPGGVNSGPKTPFQYPQAVIKTDDFIKNGENVIYEACFQYDRVLTALDILVKQEAKWNAYEVKSSVSVSDTFVLDASLQYYVIKNAGIALNDFFIIYINKDYIRIGELDLKKLFKKESVLNKVLQNQSFVKKQIIKEKEVLKLKHSPDIDIGKHCYFPYTCDFLGHCWKHIPDKSIFEISELKTEQKFELYKKGIVKANDVPKNYPLTQAQRIQIECYIHNKDFVNQNSLSEFFRTIRYPLYFLKILTVSPALPLFDNSKPYQKIPFQYSIMYKKSKQSDIKKINFIAEKNIDPRRKFIENLINDLREDGSILIYNQNKEILVLNDIALHLKKYSININSILERIIDIFIIFRQVMYYSPKLKSDYSIQNIANKLIGLSDINKLQINSDIMAENKFLELQKEDNILKFNKLKKNLNDYGYFNTKTIMEFFNFLNEKI